MPKQTYLLPVVAVAATAIHTILWFQLSKCIKAHQVHRSEPAHNSPSWHPTRPGRASSVNYDNAFREAPLKKEWKLAIRPVHDMDPAAAAAGGCACE